MTKKLLSVGLLFGGESPEHEVSIVTARNIVENLDSQRFRVQLIGIAKNGVWVVNGDPIKRLAAGEEPKRGSYDYLPLEAGAEDLVLPDIFFNAIHGASGEDGQLQGYLDTIHRPYTGAGILAMAVGMDKWITKRIWKEAGLPIVPYYAFTDELWESNKTQILENIKLLKFPLFIKPSNLGSSIGITKVSLLEELIPALEYAMRFDRRIIVEQGLHAREIEVAVLGGEEPIISVPGEVVTSGEFYDFQNKYVSGNSTIQIPAILPKDIVDLIKKYTITAFNAIDGYGMARVDFFLDHSGILFLNEINMIPGFTATSMYPKLLTASGISYKELLSRLIELALERYKKKQNKSKNFVSGSTWFD